MGVEPVIFIIYIHGGAWVDPDQTKTEGRPLLDYLSKMPTQDIGCKVACASVNYRLSSQGSSVRHPDHMNDVLLALTFLKRNYDMKKCIIIGHSAGATLAVQVFHNFRREILSMILFNGIYDLPALVDEYAEYNGFVSAAFGPLDQNDWKSPSPTYIVETTHVRSEHLHELVILAHSLEDELLSMQQTDLFFTAISSVWGEPVQRVEIHGKHDDSPASAELQILASKALTQVAKKLLQ